MRVPYSWLREYCAPDLDLAAIEHELTLSGTKVEAIHRHGVETPETVVIGHVLSCERHPDADRLSVCSVDVGQGDPATIVCGAPNVAAGQTVVVALPGTVMGTGAKIGRAKLRGVVSEGMICSEAELGISGESDGILALDVAHAPGTPAAGLLPISDSVIEFEITPNRPDCLGVYGIARELHAATGAPLAEPPWAQALAGAGTGAHNVRIDVDCPDLCPRFTARVFDDVAVGPSPLWLRARLTAAGMRPINNVVDITNYVMWLTGQPLHAFDLDRVAGERLVVRRAADGGQVETLDGQLRTLDDQMVVIDDADGPTSIAGVMGGARSEVSPQTTRVLLEVASWVGPNIHRTAQRLALRSEASSRFAKGLAPEQAVDAQELATRLLTELAGARQVGETIDAGPFASAPPSPTVIELKDATVAAVLGMEIEPARRRARLEALGFGVTATDGGVAVTVPPFRRGDVTREADLVEEVARFELGSLPATLPKRRGAAGRLTPAQAARRRALDALVGHGAHEIVGWSFTSPAVADRLRLPDDSPGRRFVTIENPMSDEHSVLRTSLIGSLLDAAAHNQAHGAHDLTLVEQGTVYLRSERSGLPDEHRALAGLMTGRSRPAGWGDSASAQAAGFFTVKAMLAAMLDALRVEWTVDRATGPFLHPGRGAHVHVGGEQVGWLGELHPLVAQSWGIDGPVGAFEVDLDGVVAGATTVPRYRDLTSYPPVRQDLAVVVAAEVEAATVIATVTEAGTELLRDVRLFDVYRGEQIGEGRVSLALSLTFQSADRTLTHEDIEPVRARIVAALAEIGGELRG